MIFKTIDMIKDIIAVYLLMLTLKINKVELIRILKKIKLSKNIPDKNKLLQSRFKFNCLFFIITTILQ